MKKLLSIAFLLATCLVFSQRNNIMTSLSTTGYLDQNGTFKATSTASLFVCTDNISSVVPSGSGSYIYLRNPQKATGNITVTGYSVTSTPSQIYTIANATIATTALSDGLVSAPSAAWASEAASGFYRIGANNYGYSINGTKVWEIASTGVSMSGITTMTNTNAKGYILTSGTSTLTDAGAVSVTVHNTQVVTTGTAAITLADGAEGQYKFIKMKTDGGDAVLTPTNLLGYTTITFNDADDFILLYFIAGKWVVITNSGCTLA